MLHRTELLDLILVDVVASRVKAGNVQIIVIELDPGYGGLQVVQETQALAELKLELFSVIACHHVDVVGATRLHQSFVELEGQIVVS